ncbi:hypothetical protein SETIT_6G121800v2 [Setaria italica]|uniref:Uncharacterized protein n=1 Tax=Setaria italica TaxID=4555 RepID=A0A368RL21_SETIT|nr:hypothetical protein SETIT_6G121800v2 [Setaria italica]
MPKDSNKEQASCGQSIPTDNSRKSKPTKAEYDAQPNGKNPSSGTDKGVTIVVEATRTSDTKAKGKN